MYQDFFLLSKEERTIREAGDEDAFNRLGEGSAYHDGGRGERKARGEALTDPALDKGALWPSHLQH